MPFKQIGVGIDKSDEFFSKLDGRIKSGGFKSMSGYIRHLIDIDLGLNAKDESLEDMIRRICQEEIARQAQ